MCEDEGYVGYPQRSICWATMQQRAADARYDAIHENAPFHDGTFEHWSEKRDTAHPYHFRDGVTIWLSDTDDTHDDDFLAQG